MYIIFIFVFCFFVFVLFFFFIFIFILHQPGTTTCSSARSSTTVQYMIPPIQSPHFNNTRQNCLHNYLLLFFPNPLLLNCGCGFFRKPLGLARCYIVTVTTSRFHIRMHRYTASTTTRFIPTCFHHF